MANPNLLSLLEDGDDDEESEHFLEFQQMLRGGESGEAPPAGAPRVAQMPSGPQASSHASQALAAQLRGAPGGQLATAAAQTPAAKAKAGALHLQIMLEWCKHHLSREENVNVHNVIKEIKAKVAQGMKPPKDVYGSILGLIGPERVKVMKVYMAREIQRRAPEQGGAGAGARPAGGAGPAGRPQAADQAPAAARPQQGHPQQGHPQQGHPAGSGGSIMQSLMYVNAEQGRHGPAASQPRPGVAQPPLAQSSPMQQHWQASAAQRATPPPGMPGYAQPQQQPPGYAQQHPRPAGLQGAHPAATGVRPGPAPAAGAAASPAALGKHLAEAAPSQPGPKRARKDKDDAEDENDVLKDSGINLEEEESALLSTLERARAQPQPQQQQAAAAPEQAFLNAQPLNVKVLDVAKRHGMVSVDAQVGQLLSRAADVHLGALTERVFAMTRQRTDAERARPGMVQSSNLRRRLHEWNQQEQQRQAAPPQPDADSQAAGGKGPAAEEEPAGKKGGGSRKETEKQQASAANAAAAAAFGAKAQKWGSWSVDAAKKPGGGGGKAGKTPAGRSTTPQPAGGAPSPAPEAATPAVAAARAPALPPTRVRAEAMSAKLEDVVAALERDPMYQRSTLLYKLYGQLSG